MLAYAGTKQEFLGDAPDIQDHVRDAVRARLGIDVKPGSSEYRSWQASLGNAMFHALAGSALPDDAGVAIEYRIQGRGQRIDFMVSGLDAAGGSHVSIIELKQWSDVRPSPLRDCVRTAVGSGMRDKPHPSYQAWSYAQTLRDFYAVVSDRPIAVSPCAYLHNCDDPSVVRGRHYISLLAEAPTFLKPDRAPLQGFLGRHIRSGDDGEVLRALDGSLMRPSPKLVEALGRMLEGNSEFVLVDDQKVAYERIVHEVLSVGTDNKAVLIVEGGPGTGKSVIAVNALVELLAHGKDVRYATKNAAPRVVYRDRLRGSRSNRDIATLFISSDGFLDLGPDELDVALVDEAHRLVRQGGFYGNVGHDQVEEIINGSRVAVFFLDEGQHVTWKDIGTKADIVGAAERLGAPVDVMQLTAQFRCRGGDEYVAWVDRVLGLASPESPAPVLAESEYDIRVFRDPAEMRDAIFARDVEHGRSRLLAGYCWDWASKKDPTAMDITFPGTDFAMKWNLQEDGPGWIEAPTSITEVGCIHTCQGLEGDYMGVIIGPDLALGGDGLVGRPEERARTDQSLRGFKKAVSEGVPGAVSRAEELVRKTYRTLLTRGMLGTYVYCTDPAVADYLEEMLNTAAEVPA